MQADLLLDAQAQLGEGALWDEREGVLYWVDILGSQLHRYTPQTGTNETFAIRQHVSSVVLDEVGNIFVTVKDGFAQFDPQAKTLHLIASPEPPLVNARFNDGKADPAGRYWAGTMAYDFTPHAAVLYCLDTDGTISIKERDVTISNGIVWTPDHQTMYYVDSSPRVIYAFDYDKASGAITNGKIVVKVPESMGAPDGMAIDSEGQLWVAHWGYGAVVCWCPKTGEVIDEISVPASQVTSCAFGGDDLKTLYITSARDGLSDEALLSQPHAGGLFVAQTDVVGLPTYRYRG